MWSTTTGGQEVFFLSKSFLLSEWQARNLKIKTQIGEPPLNMSTEDNTTKTKMIA
jgi:hypothetical protein